MKTATKIIFASALALSTAAPTFVHAAYLQNASQIRTTGAPAQHVMDKSDRAIRGLESWPMRRPTSARGTPATSELAASAKCPRALTETAKEAAFQEAASFSVRIEDRPQVLELVEEVPDVVAGAPFPVRMQVGDFWIVAVAVKGRL